jgi:hypothetical protein
VHTGEHPALRALAVISHILLKQVHTHMHNTQTLHTILQILLQPDTGAERLIRAELQKDIKAESLMVIKLADEQRIDLEWPEAIEIAKEQVL